MFFFLTPFDSISFFPLIKILNFIISFRKHWLKKQSTTPKKIVLDFSSPSMNRINQHSPKKQNKAKKKTLVI